MWTVIAKYWPFRGSRIHQRSTEILLKREKCKPRHANPSRSKSRPAANCSINLVHRAMLHSNEKFDPDNWQGRLKVKKRRKIFKRNCHGKLTSAFHLRSYIPPCCCPGNHTQYIEKKGTPLIDTLITNSSSSTPRTTAKIEKRFIAVTIAPKGAHIKLPKWHPSVANVRKEREQ